MAYKVIDAVGWLSMTADRIGADRAAAALHTLWRRMGMAWHPDTFGFLR